MCVSKSSALFSPLVSYKIRSRDKVLSLAEPRVMGILNVTPDSFSDGGKFNEVDRALAHCEQMVKSGVDIVDIGGESTRPNASVVGENVELERVLPVVLAIRKHFGDELWLSIDTSSPEVIKQAYEAGADIWNDVRALRRDGAVQMASELSIPVVLMHMRGEPDTMNGLASYDDVLDEVIAELGLCVDRARQAGVKEENIILDVGFGFAKNYEHHCQLLTHLRRFEVFNLPLLFGISRKRFLGEVLNKSGVLAFSYHDVMDRDAVGMLAGVFAVQQGASIIRTHNVEMMVQGLALWKQLGQSLEI